MIKESLELKAKSGSVFYVDRVYDDDGSVKSEDWSKLDPIKNILILLQYPAAYVSLREFERINACCSKLNESGVYKMLEERGVEKKEVLTMLFEYSKREHYRDKGGYLLILIPGEEPKISSREIVEVNERQKPETSAGDIYFSADEAQDDGSGLGLAEIPDEERHLQRGRK